MHCSVDSACVSINYQKDMELCEFNDVNSFSGVYDSEITQGWETFNEIKGKKLHCFNNICNVHHTVHKV